ncbi:hypothetical protein FJP69_18715 [Stenotrophomonas maltophilia]|nr:hypothetical protein FJP69_18715 [Stenotrophomonas maltophilia]
MRHRPRADRSGRGLSSCAGCGLSIFGGCGLSSCGGCGLSSCGGCGPLVRTPHPTIGPRSASSTVRIATVTCRRDG